MRLFGRKPQPPLGDLALLDLSTMFWEPRAPSAPYPETPGAELLAGGTWDYSLQSLRGVEDYLAAMRARNPEGREGYSMVLRSGAYVGEVLRRNSALEWHWLKYEDALAVEPRLRDGTEAGIPTEWVLWDGRNGFAFPLGRVVKFFQNGPADSVYTFVAGMVGQE